MRSSAGTSAIPITEGFGYSAFKAPCRPGASPLPVLARIHPGTADEMLRYDIFYLMAALLASPVVAARLFGTGKWRTDWRGRFGHVGVLDVQALPTDDAPGSGGSANPVAAASEVTTAASEVTAAASEVTATASEVTATASDTPASADRPDGAPARPQPPTVLVHGVSVGEVAATRQLVDRLAASARLVVSSTTDTGVERARSLYAAHHPVVRYPLDLSWMVRRFLDAVRPDVVALTELEVWPNFVTECTRRGIPVCVVNGRLSASSYRGYRRARGWMRPIFRQLAAVGAQNEVYARRFADLGVPRDRVRVTDTMKWDTSGRPLPGRPATAATATELPAAEALAADPAATELPATEALATDPATEALATDPAAEALATDPTTEALATDSAATDPATDSPATTLPAAEALAVILGLDRSRPLIVAGSTGPGEEEELIATRPPAAQLLLVPRKPERFDAVAALHPGIRRRSRAGGGSSDPEGATPANEAVPPPSGHVAGRAHPRENYTADRGHPPAPDPAAPTPTDLYLLDTMGELELAYTLADVAIVGRSFAPLGGSDPIPPVAAGCATIIGPRHENFADVVSALRAAGGVTVTSSPKEAMEAAARLLQDAAARRRMARRGRSVIEERRGASARSAELVLGLLGGG